MVHLLRPTQSLLPQPNTEAELLFCNAERESEKSANSLVGKAVCLGGGIIGVNLCADYMKWPNTYVTAATVTAALAYFLPLIQSEKQRVVTSSFALLDKAQGKLSSPKTQYELSSFPLPPNLGVLPQNVLDQAYEEAPVRYYRSGGRIGVGIDGRKMGAVDISRTLEILHRRYPQIRRISFRNVDVSCLNLLPDLRKFRQLNRVTFEDCRNIREEDLEHSWIQVSNAPVCFLNSFIGVLHPRTFLGRLLSLF